ncbi:MAG: hypothetical protein ABIT36_00845 [Steroidobacteraceae bacterium]
MINQLCDRSPVIDPALMMLVVEGRRAGGLLPNNEVVEPTRLHSTKS